MPRLTIILDLDGVLITNLPTQPEVLHTDGYTDFDASCVANLNVLVAEVESEVWLISARRKGKTLLEMQAIFNARGIAAPIVGMVPVYADGMKRNHETIRFIRENNLEHYLIIDDNRVLRQLPRSMKNRLVQTDFARGFNKDKLEEARRLLGIT
jgi:hypothetical protein